MRRLKPWIETELKQAMIFGNSGMGIQGISQTAFFLFVISSEGLSQLGITIQDASNLLKAYESTFRVSVRGGTLRFDFGDVAKLIARTPHPEQGASLSISSWLEFVTTPQGGPGHKVLGFGYVPRSRLDPDAQKEIRLNAPLGGLMLPGGTLGSTGRWEFPPKLQRYDTEWVRRNAVPIQEAVQKRVSELLVEELKRG